MTFNAWQIELTYQRKKKIQVKLQSKRHSATFRQMKNCGLPGVPSLSLLQYNLARFGSFKCVQKVKFPAVITKERCENLVSVFPCQDKQIESANCKSVTTLELQPLARQKINYFIYGTVFLCLTTTQSQAKQWKISHYFYCVYKPSLSNLSAS